MILHEFGVWTWVWSDWTFLPLGRRSKEEGAVRPDWSDQPLGLDFNLKKKKAQSDLTGLTGLVWVVDLILSYGQEEEGTIGPDWSDWSGCLPAF